MNRNSDPRFHGNLPVCEGGYNECTHTDVELVEDPYAADVHNLPGQMMWLCPACSYQRSRDI